MRKRSPPYDDAQAEQHDLALLEKIMLRGQAEIARGNFTTIAGPEDGQKLMRHFNERAAERARARKAGRPAKT